MAVCVIICVGISVVWWVVLCCVVFVCCRYVVVGWHCMITV